MLKDSSPPAPSKGKTPPMTDTTPFAFFMGFLTGAFFAALIAIFWFGSLLCVG